MATEDDSLENAKRAEESGDIAAALQYLDQVVTGNPRNSVVWAWMGNLEVEREQYAAAIAAFERALKLDPQLAGALSGMGRALESMGKLHEAEVVLKKSVIVRPTAARFVLLGDVQLQLHLDGEAESSFREALRLEPDNTEALFNLALLIRPDASDQATMLLRRAIEIDPLYAGAYGELGFQLLGDKALDEAEHMLRTSIVLDPSKPWTRIYLANTLWAQGFVDEAESEFMCARDLAPLWGLPSLLLGNLYEDLGRSAEAEQCYHIAVTSDPTDADAAYHLGAYYRRIGTSTAARHWLERALELNPSHALAKKILDALDHAL